MMVGIGAHISGIKCTLGEKGREKHYTTECRARSFVHQKGAKVSSLASSSFSSFSPRVLTPKTKLFLRPPRNESLFSEYAAQA